MENEMFEITLEKVLEEGYYNIFHREKLEDYIKNSEKIVRNSIAKAISDRRNSKLESIGI